MNSQKYKNDNQNYVCLIMNHESSSRLFDNKGKFGYTKQKSGRTDIFYILYLFVFVKVFFGKTCHFLNKI